MTELHSQVVNAIQIVQRRIRWKSGSASRHLLKRKRRGHLSTTATLADYLLIIRSVVSDPNASVYVYYHGDTPYVTVVATVHEHNWLVMFDLNGVMESAYIVERPALYLNRPVFEQLGRLEEVLA